MDFSTSQTLPSGYFSHSQIIKNHSHFESLRALISSPDLLNEIGPRENHLFHFDPLQTTSFHSEAEICNI